MRGLLHDVVEDTDVELEQIRELFGDDVAALVDGVTKLSQLEEMSQSAKQAENFQKFILASTRDIRVLMVKLADRLHNMRTIHFMPKMESQKRKARETIEVYAPLARRVGLSIFAAELEDLAFQVINPEARSMIEKHLAEMVSTKSGDIVRIRNEIKTRIEEAGLKGDLRGRLKRAYSIWRKLEAKSASLDDLGDIFAFRLIVKDENACYQALGVTHQTWEAVPGRFKDYISVPKQNGYRSLHTNIRGPGNHRVELQIRTAEMDAVAERGVAAHWRYKNKSYGFDAEGARAAGIDADATLYRISELLQHGADPEEFMEYAKLEMYRDSVFAFTPKGQLVKLPAGASALDFAYEIHTDIGNTCIGARINGVERSLARRIENGDTVEIMRSDQAAPSPLLEGLVTTAKAKAAIRKLMRDQESLEMQALGKQLLRQGLRRIGMDPLEIKFAELAARAGYDDLEPMLEEMGRKKISVSEFVAKLFPESSETDGDSSRHLIQDDETPLFLASDQLTPGVTMHLAECCSPLPGDRVVGLHLTDRGIEVHQISCQALEDFDDKPELWVDLRWRRNAATDVLAIGRLLISMLNERGAMATVCKAISDTHGNIVNIIVRHRTEEVFDFQLDVEVEDLKRLTQIITTLKALAVVEHVDRLLGEAPAIVTVSEGSVH